MGMFDSVWIPCPNCGQESEFQSKSGVCVLENYTLENCPDRVMRDLAMDAPIFKCDSCETLFEVDVNYKVVKSLSDKKTTSE